MCFGKVDSSFVQQRQYTLYICSIEETVNSVVNRHSPITRNRSGPPSNTRFPNGMLLLRYKAKGGFAENIGLVVLKQRRGLAATDTDPVVHS